MEYIGLFFSIDAFTGVLHEIFIFEALQSLIENITWRVKRERNSFMHYTSKQCFLIQLFIEAYNVP